MGYNDVRMANLCSRELDEYRGLDHFLVRTPSQLNAIFRLRYDSYFGDGLIRENKEKSLSDNQDDDAASIIYGITLYGRLVSTIRLAIISKIEKAPTTYTLFKCVLDPMIDEGETIADVSRLAVCCDDRADRRRTILYTLKIADVFFATSGANRGAIVARHSHWPFYKRYGFELVSGPFSYPEALTPLSLMMINFKGLGERQFMKGLLPGGPVFKPIASRSEATFGMRGMPE